MFLCLFICPFSHLASALIKTSVQAPENICCMGIGYVAQRLLPKGLVVFSYMSYWVLAKKGYCY